MPASPHDLGHDPANDYARLWPRLANESTRVEKAAKMLAVLDASGVGDLGELDCLDLGCGSGIISAQLADSFRSVVACDSDRDAIEFGRGLYNRPNLRHLVADATRVPIDDRAFDVIVCAHVYEHVDNPKRLADEIHRLLKPTGVCYFSGPNLLRLHEPHLRLWLAHWLPRPILNRLLSAHGREPYAEHLRTWWALRDMLRSFTVQDANVALVLDPDRFHTTGEPGMAVASRLPRFLVEALLPAFAPSFNLLLTTGEHPTIRR